MKILYFIRGVPDKAELDEAAKSGALLRNCLAWHEQDAFEECDQVMGKRQNIPEPYRHLWQETTVSEGTAKPAKKRKKVEENAANS